MRPISQRAARRDRKRVAELENVIRQQRRSWFGTYFGATEIARTSWAAEGQIPTAIRTARRLQHAVVAIGDDSGTVVFMALPHAKEDV